MDRIEIGRYRGNDFWDGWISPKSCDRIPNWCLFVPLEGDPVLYVNRDGDLRAVPVDSPDAENLPPRTFTADD